MSEPNEAVERVTSNINRLPDTVSILIRREDAISLLAERDSLLREVCEYQTVHGVPPEACIWIAKVELASLLRIKECFDAMWGHEMTTFTDVRGNCTVKCPRGTWGGATPEQAVRNAMESLK